VINIPLRKLKDILIFQEDAGWEGNPPFSLWVLMIGGLQSLGHEEYEWFVSAASQVIMKIGCGLWEEVLDLIRSVLWIEGILELESDAFQRDISTKLWAPYGYLFS
jgi:hypothetical protein